MCLALLLLVQDYRTKKEHNMNTALATLFETPALPNMVAPELQRTSSQERRIRDRLREAGKEMTAMEIADSVGIYYDKTRDILFKLWHEKLIQRRRTGRVMLYWIQESAA